MPLTLELDRILYGSTTVAELKPGLSLATLRKLDDVFSDLPEGMNWVSEYDHEEALKAERAEGIDEGKEEARNDLQNEFDDKKAEIEEAAFDRGYEAAIANVERSADVERVEALLAALRTIANDLIPLQQGFDVEGQFKRRTAKASEVKTITLKCRAAAFAALRAFETEKR